jgi:ribosomal protein S18 acetylase RimI-like enzyme
MAGHTGTTTIRPFQDSLADARGLLAVERATFNESPYSAQQLQAMLVGGSQRAWLATGDGAVVGFVAAFATCGLLGRRWEIDLLAVHPDWSGQGIATRLIRAAAVGGAPLAKQARAVVASDNIASARAFARAGFQSAPETRQLLIYRTGDQPTQPRSISGVNIRETRSIAEAADWLPIDAIQNPPPAGRDSEGMKLLLAEQDGQPAGYAELLEVQTILYRGVWIESLVALTQAARKALVLEILSPARASRLEEIGALVPHRDCRWQQALLAEGFKSSGDFYWLTAPLPLPALTPDQPRSHLALENTDTGSTPRWAKTEKARDG